MRRNAKIYVMDAGDGTIKLGHSTEPGRRLRQLCKPNLKIVHTTPLIDEVERVERAAHRLLTLAGRRIKAEWFRASVDEAIAAIDRAARIASGDEPYPPKPAPLQRKPLSEQVAVRYPRRVLDMVEEIIVERGNVTDRATILREATVRGLETMLKRSKN